MPDFSLNSEILAQPFTLCLQWQRFADKCQLWTWKGQLISPPSNPSPAFISKVLLLCCIYLTFFSIWPHPCHLSQVSSVVLPHVASSFVSVPIAVCLNRFSLLISSSVLCTSLEVFLALFWMMCWPTLLPPARPFLTPSRVLLLAPGFAAIGSTVDVWPGSQDHQSRLFLLLSALNLPVCYPGVLTPNLFASF